MNKIPPEFLKKLLSDVVFNENKPRDSERINRILNLLDSIWNKNPDLRLGQILVNCIPRNNPYNENSFSSYLFFLEDDELEKYLQIFLDRFDDRK